MIELAEFGRYIDADFETGVLYWRERTPDMFKPGKKTAEHQCNAWNAKHAGRECLNSNASGYLHGTFDGRTLKRHRVLVAMRLGYWPEYVDHIDGNTLNNRAENLREVNSAGNARNCRRLKVAKSGHVGIRRLPGGGWNVRVGASSRNVGTYPTLPEAIRARDRERKRLGYHSNHT